MGLRPIVAFVRRAFFTKKERRLAEERDSLRSEMRLLKIENDKLQRAVARAAEIEGDLQAQKTRLQSEAAMLKDEIAVLANRVSLLNLGYRYNRELVITILGTTDGAGNAGTGIDDTDVPGVSSAS